VTTEGLRFERPLAAALREASTEVRHLRRYSALVRYTVRFSLKLENTGRVFGRLWWLIDPLLTMATYVLLINVVYGAGGDDYPVFVFTSVIAWKWFSSSVEGSIRLVLGRHWLMKQIPFPRSVLPLSNVLAATVNFGFGMLAVVLFAIPYGIRPDAALAFLPVVALVQLPLALGLAYVLSALNVLFRDVENLTQHALRLWFYLSPALYTTALVPERFRPLFELNPFAWILPAYHDVVLGHRAPDLVPLAAVFGASLLLLAAGFTYYVRTAPSFVKVM
jgi:lipopolysaccharide transport system permease protein